MYISELKQYIRQEYYLLDEHKLTIRFASEKDLLNHRTLDEYDLTDTRTTIYVTGLKNDRKRLNEHSKINENIGSLLDGIMLSSEDT